MKIFGSISRLVSIIFRKDGQDLTVRPNQSTTYTAARDVQLPVGDADHELVGTAASQTLSNKSIDGDSNTLSNIGLGSLKVQAGDADKLLMRDGSGAVISAKLENKHVAANAAIALSKLAALSSGKVLVSDGSGVISASSITATELGYLSGASSNLQAQIDTKASSSSVNSAISQLQSDLADETDARQAADSALDSRIDNLSTSDIAEGSNLYFTEARAKSAVVIDTGYIGTETNKSLSVRAVVDAFADVTSAIDNLQTDLEAADAALASDIAAETSARQSAVSAEASARQSADNALDARLDVIEGPDSQSGSLAKVLKDAKAYADSSIASLVNSAPSVLDTLKELADAINDDPNFATTVAGQIGSISSDLSSEVSRAQAAEAALDGRLDILEGADSVNGSVAKALKDAKAYTDSSVSSEASARQAADSDLQDAIDAEISDRQTAISSVESSLSSEASARAAADSALDGRLDILEGNENTAGSVAKALKDAKAYTDAETSARQSAVSSEASARQAADADLQDAIDQEVSDRQAAISSEASARQSADSALDARLDILEGADSVAGSVAKALKDAKAYTDAETSARQSAVSAVAADLASEISNRQSAVSNEASLREAADQALASDLSDEQAAREAADSALDARLDVLEGADIVAGSVAKALKDAKAYTDAETSARQSAVSAEQSARESADSALDARLDILEGADSVAGSVAKSLKDAKAYADQKISDLVDGAPALLNTLNELAAALGDDENFAVSVTNSIANEVSARQAADQDLQDAIDALDASVTSAISSASSSLAGDLADEVAARQAADAQHDLDIATKLNKPTSGDAANKYLRSNGDGSTYWDVGYVLPVYKTTWSAANGTSKAVVHNLGSSDVVVSFIDLSDNSVIGVSSVVITDANTVTCSASEAPSASGWRVLVQKI
jgi:hypothetical protein